MPGKYRGISDAIPDSAKLLRDLNNAGVGPRTIANVLGTDIRRVQGWAGTFNQGTPKGTVTADEAKALRSLHSERKTIAGIVRQGAKTNIANLPSGKRKTQSQKDASRARSQRGLAAFLKAKLSRKKDAATRATIIDSLIDIGAEPHDREKYFEVG